MHVDIETSDPDNVDPERVARILQEAGFFVLSVEVNGERTWNNEAPDDVPETPRRRCSWVAGHNSPDGSWLPFNGSRCVYPADHDGDHWAPNRSV